MKLRVLHSRDTRTLARALENKHMGNSEAARLYGRIIILLDTGEAEQAEPLVRKLIKLQPNSSAATLIAARVARESGNYARAEKLFSQIIDFQPDNYAATQSYIDMLGIQGRDDRAERVIRTYLRNTRRPSPDVFRKYASVLKRKGRTVHSHEALANYYRLLDENAEAVAQLEIALKSTEQDSNEQSRIAAQIAEARRRLR